MGMSPREMRIRRKATPLEGASVVRHGYWIATCPRHGETGHLSYLGGKCERCAAEQLSDAQVKGPT